MGSDTGPPDVALEDFSLREAARLYTVELSTLQNRARRGRLDAFKARGPWGREWRVTRMTLEAEGFLPRPGGDPRGDDERVAVLERELAAARRAAAAERRRAEEADRRLGQALLEQGRLRTALALSEVDLDRPVPAMVDMEQLRDLVAGPRRAPTA